MLGFPIQELFHATVQSLPRLFLFGAPIVLALLALAAAADASLPGGTRTPRNS
jgi:hypothetical protein